jgi:hypothetical protein
MTAATASEKAPGQGSAGDSLHCDLDLVHTGTPSYAGGLQKFDICGVKKRKSPIREPLKVTRKGDFIERH